MKCGKLTAKLRDAVPVRFFENGKEVKRYKNIEIPDAVKELEFQNFKFEVPLNGAITFTSTPRYFRRKGLAHIATFIEEPQPTIQILR